MKSETKYLIIFLIIYVPYLLLRLPLNNILINNGISELKSQFISTIMMVIPLLISLIWLVEKLNFKKFNGIYNGLKMVKSKFLFLPLLFLIFVVYNDYSIIINSNITELFLLTISVILVGLSEELFFRGILLPLFITKFKDEKYFLFLSVFLSSLIFGLLHFINLINIPSNILGITVQVFFAFCIGVLLSGLLLKTKYILIPALIHAIVNFKGTLSLLNNTKQIGISKHFFDDLPDAFIWDVLSEELPFNILLLLGGYILIRKIDKKELLKGFNNLDPNKEDLALIKKA